MEQSNVNSRLEAFCDAVFAIALTLLIIDIRFPPSDTIKTAGDFWLALQHLLPAIFAFLLSFMVIFITWVNHHAAMKLIDKSSLAFIYANGFLLLTIVVLPFPTSLLSEYLFTDHAAPAVMLYSAILALQAIAWFLICQAVLKPLPLTKDEKSSLAIRVNQRTLLLALGIYTLGTIAAFWSPQVVAFLVAITWPVWVLVGIRITGE